MKHQCVSCGTVFEGNFCPECGAKWQDPALCPQCGAPKTEGAKFCSKCGYSFFGAAPQGSQAQAAPQADMTGSALPMSAALPAQNGGEAVRAPKQAGKFTRGLHAFLPNVPAALSLVISVLLFLFYLAPYSAIRMSVGNVYQGIADPTHRTQAVSLVICAVFLTIYSIVWLVKVRKGGYSPLAYNLVGAVLWMVFSDVASVLSLRASLTSISGMGGSCVALQLAAAFSNIYLVIELIAVILIRKLPKRFANIEPVPQYRTKISVLLYDFLADAPMIFFAVFGFALFLIYLTPVRAWNGGFIGASVKETSLYALLSQKSVLLQPLYKIPTFSILAAAMVAIAVLMVFYTVIWLFLRCAIKKKGTLLTALSCILPTLLLICTAALCTILKNNGLGKGDTSLIVPLILSVVYLFFVPFSMLLRFLLTKKTTAQEEIGRRKQTAEAWKATHAAPERPQKPEKPPTEFGGLVQQIDTTRKLVISAVPVYFLSISLFFFCMTAYALVFRKLHEDYGDVSMLLGFLIPALLFMVFALLGWQVSRCTKFGKTSLTWKRRFLILRIVLSCLGALALLFAFIVIFISNTMADNKAPDMVALYVAFWVGFALQLFVFIYQIVVSVKYKKYLSKLVSFGSEEWSAALRLLSDWQMATAAFKNYRYRCICYEQGRDYTQAGGLTVWVTNHKALTIVLLSVLALGLAIVPFVV